MSLASWVGQKLGLGIGDYPMWRQIFHLGSKSGGRGGVEAALKLSAWWCNIRLIAETIGTLPGDLYERISADERRPAERHDLYSLLKFEPNGEQTKAEFWEAHAAGLCFGNGYAEKRYIGSRLVALQPLHFEAVHPYRDANTGAIRYRFHDRGKEENLPSDKIFHTKGFGFGGIKGVSVVEFAAGTIINASATEAAARKMFEGGMRASGFMLSPTTLTKPQRDQLQKNVVDPVLGPDSEGAVGVLEAGFKWQPANVPPKDAEMLLSRRFNVEEVCRWFGTPPVLIGHAAEGQTMWGSGIEQIMLGWLVLGLRRYLVRIEQSINKRLLPPEDRKRFYFEFNVEGLLRADSAGRAALMASLAQNGLRNRNELRRLDNLPPFAGGDTFTAQSNLMPIAMLGQASNSDANAVRNALVAWLADIDRKGD